MEHMIYRYGAAEVGGWIFEISYHDYFQSVMGIYGEYSELFGAIYGCIKSFLPMVRVGGCGVGASVNEGCFQNIIRQFREKNQQIDFISIYIFPYRRQDMTGNMFSIRRKHGDFFQEDLVNTRNCLKENGRENIPVFVMEWNMSFTHRNYYNDSCAKGAMMLHLMASRMEEVELGAYWVASDLFAGYFDTDRLLNGAGGLISNDGICKPSFYAIKFIGQVYGNLVKKGNGYIITCDGRGNYSMVLYNHKEFNYYYYSKKEYEIGMDEVDCIFENLDPLEMTIVLEHIPNGRYHVRRQAISPEWGSVLNEWKQLGTDSALTAEDIFYLRQQCVPYRQNSEAEVQDGKFVLQQRLAAHEIMLLQIQR